MPLYLKDLIENFEEAIILDVKKKNVWIVKDKRIKVYPEKYYQEIVSGLNLVVFNGKE